MHSAHNGLSIVVPIMNASVIDLSQTLRVIKKNPSNNSLIPFANSETTHYASGVIVPEQCYQNKTPLPATFMFFTSFSGPIETHINELIKMGRSGLCQLFGHCCGFPDEAKTDNEALKRFLKKYNQPHTFYSGMHHVTPRNVKQDEELRKAIKSFVDQGQVNRAFDNKDDYQIKALIETHIRNDSKFAWVQQQQALTLLDYAERYKIPQLLGVAAVGVAIAALPNPARNFVLGAALIGIVATIAYIDSQDAPPAEEPTDEELQRIQESQCNLLINELTAANVTKGGTVRSLLFRLVLRTVSLFTGMINIPTVATARWLATDGGKRLVFISNYSHSAESYVRDFINSKSSATGINLLFGHGLGFPKTSALIYKGAKADPEGFMNAVRKALQPCGFWYCPNPHLSVYNINNNKKIREGLFKKMGKKQTRDWLDLL